MIKNYLKVTYRNLIKHKSYSMINIFGLSLGITCSILILSYIGYELSYDSFHENADNIYRIASRRTLSGKTSELAISPAPVGPTLAKDFPEVVDSVRFGPTVKRVFTYEDKNFFQEGVLYVDNSVFNVFSFELIEGDPKTALEAPFTMVLTEETAKKIFGDESPVGKIVNWDNKFDYQITGVVKDPPKNLHFMFNVLASFSTFIKYDPRIGSWRGGSYQTYLLLQENTDLKEFSQKIRGFDKKYQEPIFRESGTEVESFLQPLKSIHLHSDLQGELGANSDIRVIYVFSAVAAMILLVACINFMNLATSRSVSRAKEVGLRKVLGAERKKLVFQFLGESFVFAVLSMAAAVVMAQLYLPSFRVLAGKDIPLDFLEVPYLSAGLAAIVLFVGFAAGSYPALFLSAFKPVSALRAHVQQGSKSSGFRSILVVFQFAVSIILIICTMIVFSQHKFMQDKDLGFNKEDLLVIALQNEEVRIGLESFKNEALKIDGVVSAGASSMVPGEIYLFNIGAYPEGFSRDQMFRMDNFRVDHGFLDTLRIDVTQGRGFSKERAADHKDGVMINETAAKRLEWEDPLGKKIEVPLRLSEETTRKTVIGVFRDIHQRSLYSGVEPTVIEYIRNEGGIDARARRLTLRLNTDEIHRAMAEIEQKWEETYPNNPYYSFFLDEFYGGQHRAEEKLGNIFRTFSILAVIIGCLGLFGLVSFTAERRTKEIGIRKVLGSSVRSIVVLLCKRFVILVLAANLLAWPIAYSAMKIWLQNFPYPVNIGINVFVGTALLTLLVALLTVSYQAVKAARVDPVQSLRHE